MGLWNVVLKILQNEALNSAFLFYIIQLQFYNALCIIKLESTTILLLFFCPAKGRRMDSDVCAIYYLFVG